MAITVAAQPSGYGLKLTDRVRVLEMTVIDKEQSPVENAAIEKRKPAQTLHRCAICKQYFMGREDAYYCSKACQQRAYRNRRMRRR